MESWEKMENMPKQLREALSSEIQLHPLEIIHITGSQNIEPQRALEQILSLKTPKEKPIILVC